MEMPGSQSEVREKKPTSSRKKGGKRKASNNTSSSAQDESVLEEKQIQSKHQSKKNKKDAVITNTSLTTITSHFASIGQQSTMNGADNSARADDTKKCQQQSPAADADRGQSSNVHSQQNAAITPTEQLILNKLTQNGEKMDMIMKNIERMESTLFSLQQESDRLKKDLTEVRTKQEDLQSTVRVLGLKAEKAYLKSNENEQYSRNTT